MRSIELYGTEVAPRVRQQLDDRRPPDQRSSRAFSTTSVSAGWTHILLAGHLVDGLAEAHALDERLDQGGRLRAR